MNDDELIFDDEEFDDPVEGQEPDTDPIQEDVDDLTTEVLKLKGISDPQKIKFEDESGAIIERSWDSLSRDEQINILGDNVVEQDDTSLTEDEINLINNIRSNNMTVDQYMEAYLQANHVQEPTKYDIDQLSDEEVYAVDLLQKVGSENITDEELEEAINTAKQNEALFNKTVAAIRKEYINLQKDKETQKQEEYQKQQLADYQNFSNAIHDEISNLDTFAGQQLELSNDDKEMLSKFILELDDNGLSAFGHALRNPQILTKAAFWLLNEDEIVGELSKQIQESYKRGYELGKQEIKPKVVYQPKNTSTTNDIFVDDDEW